MHARADASRQLHPHSLKRTVKLWQILIALGLGMLYGVIAPHRLTYAFGQAMLYVFLPALLFEAAWNLNVRAMRRQWVAIAALAGPGVLLTAAIVAGALCIVGMPPLPAFLTGAILSATDPISVVAVFRRLPVPQTLSTIVECEALFNDAVAVALYSVALTVVGLRMGSAGAVATVTFETMAGAVGGVAVGVAIAFVAARLLRRTEWSPYQILATTLCAYGAYFLSDSLRLSGIFATIACGIALRRYERASITLRIVADVGRFWDIAALMTNALVFFLAGAALDVARLGDRPLLSLACIAGVGVARFAVGELLLPRSFPRQWINVVRVAGMRGALCLALALAIPASVPYRDAIINATVAVSLTTMLVCALTIGPLLRPFRHHTPSG